MINVFGDLVLNSISDPLADGAFFFEKGKVKSFHYKNLSGGEKAAFDLLLDLQIKAKHYDDTVFCIDEPEMHMHTRLQAKLIKELVNIIPDHSQLWLATHSLGVDRDDKSRPELDEMEQRQIISTGLRNLECYLFDDEVLEALLRRINQESLKEEVQKLKLKAIQDSIISRGNPPDDIKSAAGEIYVELKKLLRLTSCGSNVDAFMRDALAPLVVPSMNIYRQMENDIVQKARNIARRT